MADKAWKHAERRIADFIGGKRVPVSGRGRGDQPDIDHAWLAVEAKYRKELPKWLFDAMDQAEKSAKPRQMPCVILIEKGQRVGDALICFRLSDAREQWL